MNPPPGLTPNGLKKFEKNPRDPWLMFNDFESFEAWMEYKDNKALGPIVNELLAGVSDPGSIDPTFVRNLSRELTQIREDLYDLRNPHRWD